MTEKQHDPKYRFVFAEEVEKIYAEFPEIRDKIVFVDVAEDDYKKAGYADNIVASLDEAKENKSARCITLAQQGVSYVAIYVQRDASRIMTRETSLATELRFTLYHELAHAVLPHMQNTHMDESASDAYAAIRLLKESGDDTRPLERLMLYRTASAITDRGVKRMNYFTAPVIQTILDNKQQIIADTQDMHGQALADYSESFVHTHCLRAAMMNEVRLAFNTLGKHMRLPEDFNLSALQRDIAQIQEPVARKWATYMFDEGLVQRRVILHDAATTAQPAPADKDTAPARTAAVNRQGTAKATPSVWARNKFRT